MADGATLSLDFVLQPKQKSLLDMVRSSPASWLGFGGALGGGKSALVRYVMLVRRLENKGTVGLIFRRKLKDLRDNHIDPMLREFPQLRPYWREQKKHLLLPGGSTLIFGSGEHEQDIEDYLGNEYHDIAVDQAEGVSEKSLMLLHARCRWPGVAAGSCKTLLTFNPGGQSAAFLRRVFYDKQYRANERPDDYAFTHAYGWDNVRWVEAYLAAIGITGRQYYREWTDQQRFECFTQHSEYGQTLMRMPEGLRSGWLYGNFDTFAGQYFDNFDVARHVVEPHEMLIRPWFKRWIGLDYGFNHPAAAVWCCQAVRRSDGPDAKPCYYAYRERVERRLGSSQLAEMIADASMGEDVDAMYIGADAKQKRDSHETPFEQMNRVFREREMKLMSLSDNERRGGWRLLYDLLGQPEDAHPQLVISSACKQLIGALPLLAHDQKHDGDAEKFDADDQGEGGDDVLDAFRYALVSRLRPSRPTFGDAVTERLAALPDPNDKAMEHRRLLDGKRKGTWHRPDRDKRRPLSKPFYLR